MPEILTKLNQMKMNIEKHLDYPFLSEHINKPEIDEDRLLLLLSFFEKRDIPAEKKDNYILTTMLLQIALDTHDQVTNDPMNETNQRKIQLTVLAGTYFSGLYYRILAKQKDIDVIRVLSEGVEIINDEKITLYQQDFDEIDLLIASLAKIEASLFQKLAGHFQDNHWRELFSSFLLLKRLISEKEMFKHKQDSPLFDVLKKIVFSKPEQPLKELSPDQNNYLLLVCDRSIEYAKELLIKARKNIPFLNTVLEERIEQLLGKHQVVLNTLAEEG